MAWTKMVKLENGIDGISPEIKKMYDIREQGLYLVINSTTSIDMSKIIEVAESELEYEIRTTYAYIHIEKRVKQLDILIRG